MTEKTKSSNTYVVVEPDHLSDENEIDLLELIRTLFQQWKTIVLITVVCVGLAFTYAHNSPDVFRAVVLLAPSTDEKPGTPSVLSQFNGLAAMAGIANPLSTNTGRVLATLETREFLKSFVKNKNLLPKVFSKYWDESSNSWLLEEGQDQFVNEDAVPALQGAIEIEDKKSGLISLSIIWQDPVFAAELANDLVKQLNEQLREKAIANSQKRVGYLEQELSKTSLQDMRAILYNLLTSEKQKAMLANVNEDFALEVIDPAVVPKSPEMPNRKKIVVLGGLCGGFLGIFMVLLAQFLRKLKFSSDKVHS